MDPAQVQKFCNHVILDEDDTRVIVVQRLRIDQQATTAGCYAVGQLQPTSVRIERAGQPVHVVELDRIG
ncbi:MAG: hypothetical protein KJO82_03165 [Gammaproteobacteria bacterium]|nr:hypothetical protein [Gammaproteobacteria bacterium]